MGKHHRGPNTAARIKTWLNRPGTAPTTLIGLSAIVLAVGLTGWTPTRVGVESGPEQTPEVRSTRPLLTVAPSAAGGRTEPPASSYAPRPTRTTSVPRPRAVEVPTPPARGRSTSTSSSSAHPTPATSSPAATPSPRPKRTCKRRQG